MDEGCDDDKDGYCDLALNYTPIGGTTTVCGTANENQTLTLDCGVGSTITAVDFASYGTPTGTCKAFGTSACHASSSVQTIKNLCLGKTSCAISANNTTFGDPCVNIVKSFNVQVTCTGSAGVPPQICPKGAGDSDDLDPQINPAGKEICDGKDNDSDGLIDEGCDDDKDGFCDSTMIVVGAPAICPKGGLDCNDDVASVNPGAAENCNTAADDDCNGTTNDQDGANCTVFFYDGDGDAYGTKQFKCYCAPVGLFKAKKTADCDDTKASINPGAIELCDNIDNNCSGEVDDGCDDDQDGYCDAAQGIAAGGAAICPNGGADCDDTSVDVNPGKAEICGNGVDDNCSGGQNDAGAIGCSNFYADGDGDGFGSTSGKCMCEAAGSFVVSNNSDCDDSNKSINPTANEICDDKDNDCSGVVDEGCDDDNDDYCDISMVVTNASTCTKGGGDCNDGDGTVNAGISPETCNGKDDNCDGVIDDGCDDDKDGYCDAALSVSNPPPAICAKGIGDCDDLDSDRNPGAAEVCGDGFDNNCNGSQNDENAINCKKLYFDGDLDGYGLNIGKCLCTGAGGYSATNNGDCDDSTDAVKPGAPEVCGDGLDNNCNGDENDENATGCKAFYLDGDKDGFGLSNVAKCYCVAKDTFTAAAGGDCNDASAAVNPGKSEACNNIDDNCKLGVDEGCNKDSDGYCDAAMTTIGLPLVCPLGGGDCNDTNANANPGKAEQCDDIDNNCNTKTDEGCDDDGDKYCDAIMTTVGKPASCTSGGGDCDDATASINPGATEQCATTQDDNCNGSNADENAVGCVSYGMDADGDTYGDNATLAKCLCKAASPYTATKTNDCNDKNSLVNPGITELCDGVDNNCDGAVDENCDKDKDGYCDANLVTIGKPASCVKGGGDCADSNVAINPGVTEVCGNTVDENCDGSTNGLNATGCTTFYLDNDADTWAVNVSQCWCVPTGKYTANGTKLGDCDDTVAAVNPGATEVCGNNLDDNCNGTQNDVNATGCVAHYKDGDKDGYGTGASQCQCYAEGQFITTLSGDCDDANAERYPNYAEKCDAIDNNCNTTVDEGCDDDGDTYCDAAMTTIGKPAACVNGGGDCNDTNNAIKPKATELCDNVDQNCDAQTDEGCDDDKDGYCDKNLTLVGTPAICVSGGNDCDDGNSQVRPGKAEICDNADNNCSGATDEGCDDDGDKYCDASMSIIGIPTVCTLGGGDCVDTSASVNPGAAEVCDGLDNNCAGGTDETCKDSDGDGYCVGNVAVSATCPKGGNDCDDTRKDVNPGATEVCATQYDDNCDGNNNPLSATGCTNYYTDADGDGYGVGAASCYCFQVVGKTALQAGDCDDAKAAVNPAGVEVCDGIDNNCVSGADESCDTDADGYCNSAKLITSTATCAKTAKPAAGATAPGDDCNDTSASVFPGAAESCDNLDNNCNASIDEQCDDDNDNYCDAALGISSPPPSTCTAGGGDCNDNDTNVKPGVAELCTTAYDDNCNGQTNEQGATGCTNYYLDVDGDGYGTASMQCWCAISGNYRATKGGDCNDNNAAVFPNNAAELCDGADNNCNGVVDEGCDDDGDQYCDKAMGFAGAPPICPKGAGDCDDNSKFVNPTAAESCDDIDNNCNATVDEACNADNDGYCASNKVVVGTPAVCIKGGGDCNDTTAAVNPATAEVCDGLDNNCNNQIDEAGSAGCAAWYYDGDQDGFGTNSSQCLCAAAGLYTTKNTGDCNDTCPTCAPGKPELCDNGDNNCNGLVDENCNKDNDGYCDAAFVTVGTPPVCTKGGGDCNDSNASVSPGTSEQCNNLDDNCNGIIDENASDACAGYANAITGCVAGACTIKNCMPGFYNINGSLTDGCECNGSDQYEPNDTCASAYVVTSSLKDNGQKEVVTGRLVDATDTDWYAVYAKDNGDSGYAACDAFNVRAVFLSNPGDGLRFDIWKGQCPAGGTNSVCCGRKDFSWFTNFKGASNGDASRQWSEYGECPCQTGNQFDRNNTGWSVPPGYPGGGGPYCMNYNSGYVCIPTGYYFTQCQDNSDWFYVKVYKAQGGPNCGNYTLEFSNGLYGQPGSGSGLQYDKAVSYGNGTGGGGTPAYGNWLVGTPCNGTDYGGGCTPQETGYHYKGNFNGYECWWHTKNQAWNTTQATNIYSLAQKFGLNAATGTQGWCYPFSGTPSPTSYGAYYNDAGNTGAWGWCGGSAFQSGGWVCLKK